MAKIAMYIGLIVGTVTPIIRPAPSSLIVANLALAMSILMMVVGISSLTPDKKLP